MVISARRSARRRLYPDLRAIASGPPPVISGPPPRVVRTSGRPDLRRTAATRGPPPDRGHARTSAGPPPRTSAADLRGGPPRRVDLAAMVATWPHVRTSAGSWRRIVATRGALAAWHAVELSAGPPARGRPPAPRGAIVANRGRTCGHDPADLRTLDCAADLRRRSTRRQSAPVARLIARGADSRRRGGPHVADLRAPYRLNVVR